MLQLQKIKSTKGLPTSTTSPSTLHHHQPLKLEPVSDDDQSLRGYVDDVNKMMPSCVGEGNENDELSARVVAMCTSSTKEPPARAGYHYSPLKVRIPDDHYEGKYATPPYLTSPNYASPPYFKDAYNRDGITPIDADHRSRAAVPKAPTMPVLASKNEIYYKKDRHEDTKGVAQFSPGAENDWGMHSSAARGIEVPDGYGYGDCTPIGSPVRQLPVKPEVMSPSSYVAVSSSTSLTPMSPAPDYDGVIVVMQKSFNELSAILMRPASVVPLTHEMSMNALWDSQMTNFAHDAGATLKFAKKVPGFRSFTLEDQIEIVQNCMFPIVLVVLSLIYDTETSTPSWFGYTPEETRILLENFEPFQLLIPSMHKMGRIVRDLDLDETETSFLCGLFLMDSGNKSEYKDLLLDSLAVQCKRKWGESNVRCGRILMCLRDMAEADQAHHEAIGMLLRSEKYCSLEIPQLFKESFIGLDT